MTNQLAKAEKWAVDKLKLMFPAEPNPIVIEVTRVPATAEERAYYLANELEWPSEHKAIPTEIGAIRTDDAILLRELGYPAIPERVQAYNDYCALDPEAQRAVILRLLEAAVEKQNQAAWDEAADLVGRMTDAYKIWGFEHPHYRELQFEIGLVPRPKPGKRRSDATADQRKALMKTLVTLLVNEFGLQASHNDANNNDCACAIVARVCAAHFEDTRFTESAAHTAYYRR